MQKTLIIIPCYNEQNAIETLVSEVEQVIKNIPKIKCDVLIVNDCSTDNSLQKIKNSGVNYLNLSVNLGIGGAMQTGYLYAKNNNYDIAIQLDGDGQHNPKYIQKLLQPILKKSANVVIGSRFMAKKGYQSTFLRRIGIHYFYELNKILVQVKVLDATSGFRALDKQAIRLVCEYYPETYPEPESIILYAKNELKIKEVSVKMRSRDEGVSSITGFKTLFYMIKVTFGTLSLYLRLKNNKK